jgi:amino acid transporter
MVEIAGLVLVLFFGFWLKPDLLDDVARLVPPFELSAWTRIASAGLLAFFAFVGFEDLANVAEEAKDPARNMPRAIILTLIIATLVYLAVVSVVVLAVPMNELVDSASPLTLVFSESHPSMRATFSLVAAVATLNGALVQIIMASRVIYGLAAQGRLDKRLAVVSPRTHTPLVATGLVAGIVLVFAIFFPIASLAKWTSQLALIVFGFVNLALIVLKRQAEIPGQPIFTVPAWVPWIGLVTCAALFLSGFL